MLMVLSQRLDRPLCVVKRYSSTTCCCVFSRHQLQWEACNLRVSQMVRHVKNVYESVLEFSTIILYNLLPF